LVNNLGIGEHWKGGGYITLSWNDPRAEGLNFTEGLDWFELKFKKTERFKKTSLSISEEKLGTEAFNGKFQSMGVKMEQIDLLNHSGKMMRVYPNPASGYMHIEWKMKHAGHAIIRILDAQGRIVYVQRGEYKSGIQRELIRRSAGWSVAGTCVVEVQTNEDVSSLPVIFIDE
jgi:hypothetical protein